MLEQPENMLVFRLFALIRANYICVDGLLGYGLKYADGFGYTHLGRVGRRKA